MAKDTKARMAHLVRPINLIIIAAAMYLFRWALVKPTLYRLNIMLETDFQSQISEPMFFLLVLSAVLIAAGGYVLNDIKDVEPDSINHGKNPVGILISEDKAVQLYNILTFSGVILSFVLGFLFDNYNLGLIQFIAASSLWFYSSYFKKQFLLGNLITALVVALVPLTVGIYEVYLLQTTYADVFKDFEGFSFNFIAFWFIGYGLFAFGFTLAREITKDLQDMEGDAKAGAKTLPIVWGTRPAKILISIIYLALGYGLYFVTVNFLPDTFTVFYAGILGGMLVVNFVYTWFAKSPAAYRKAGIVNKVISILGILYLIPFSIMLYKGFFIYA